MTKKLSVGKLLTTKIFLDIEKCFFELRGKLERCVIMLEADVMCISREGSEVHEYI
jgi:hypothetical protein